MYKMFLEEQARAITGKIYKDHVCSPPEFYQTVLVALEEWWSDKIAIQWTAEDVRGVAAEKEVELSDEEVRQVLDYVLNHHDAEIGVNWMTISLAVEDILGERELVPCGVR